MKDAEAEAEGLSEDEKKFEKDIKKEIDKLDYYLGDTEELIESGDFKEMTVVCKRTDEILDRVNDLVSQMQELKLERDVYTPRDVRQWKKDTKAKYSPFIDKRESLLKILEKREKQKAQQTERENLELKYEKERRYQEEMHERQRQMWEEKLDAELEHTQKKLELENNVRATTAKLPKLRITPFKGTPTDWVRFESMFVTQVHNKPISDEEKFGYLLEMVSPKVRERISNLKPSTVGYKTAWERLEKEFGQTKLVVNAHMEEIINLPVIKGTNYDRVKEFYESLSKNHDALQTLGEAEMLRGFVVTTTKKLPHVKPDLVRTDDNWEKWSMTDLIDNLQQWLRRHKVDDSPGNSGEVRQKKEKHWYHREKGDPICIYCEGKHWGDACEVVKTVEARRQFFQEKKLCFNCGRPGHWGKHCRSRGCFRCKSRHHTSLCDSVQGGAPGESGTVLTSYSPSVEEWSLPAIIPVKIKGEIFWAYLDTGAGRNFITSEAIKRLNLKPEHHEVRQILTVNGTKRQSMPIFNLSIESLDGKTSEEIEVTGTKLRDFTTVRRPDISKLKEQYEHTKDKRFYKQIGDEYPIHVIIGDSTYCRIKTEEVYKGQPGEPIVEGTTFGWVIHGGNFSDSQSFFSRESSDYERLYSLDVLGVRDRGEDDEFDVHTEFKENVVRKPDGRYEVNIPWIPGAKLDETNEEQSRRRLQNMERKLGRNEQLKADYTQIVEEQLEEGIVERIPTKQTGERVFYLPHKAVVRTEAVTTKVRMVFDASAKPQPLAASINECMYTGPSLQPLLWDIMIRSRMSENLLLGDIKKAFLQIGIKEEDRDAFRFLFNLNGKEEHLRFARVPFGAEASPFILGATLRHHLDQQPEEFAETVEELRSNTYVDNLMKTGGQVEEMEKFKEETTHILEDAKFTVHKWESNIKELEEQNMPNPSKILGQVWDKEDDTLEIKIPPFSKDTPVTKKSILSHLGKVYDPLGILSPTMAEGKHIYREACDEKLGWNAVVSERLAKAWLKWIAQLRSVKVPRSLVRQSNEVKSITLHLFADASSLACSAATIAVVKQDTDTVQGLLTSKSRISKRNTTMPRLELVAGQMAANMAKNVRQALNRWPVSSITIWMDSTVALYWLTSPGRNWKVFVANRVRKIAKITEELNISWKYCPTDKNIADLGSRGASLDKMEKSNWFIGPEWLQHEDEWPEQPILARSTEASKEEKPLSEVVACAKEHKPDEWDQLLERKPYWSVLRITAWAVRFKGNALSKKQKGRKQKGALCTDEIRRAKELWMRRAQRGISKDTETPGWRLVEDEDTGVFKCIGRIPGYRPTYLEDSLLTQKLIRHVHSEIKHLGVANTMAELRKEWWIPKLRSKVKKMVNTCNVCKVFSTKPYGPTATADMPHFRVEASRPFETTGVDFAGPITFKITKKEQGKCYILLFTCATSRAVHLELTKTQTAEEFQRRLNAFIARRTRPKLIVSDNASVFKSTATWIKNIRKSERLQDYLAKQDISWRFNLSRSPWWGGMYERLIKDVKKTLHKTLGRTNLNFEHLEAVIIDIEKNLNNRPLTYLDSDGGEEQVLTPNTLMWGQNAHPLEGEEDEDETSALNKRLKETKNHAWKRWRHEYVHSLLESHRINRKTAKVPDIGEIVLVVGDEKNRGEWKKGKVVQHIRGKDGIVRGVSLLHKGHHIDRPLNLVCPLEIKGTVANVREVPKAPNQLAERTRVRRQAAETAREKIRRVVADEDDY